MNFDRRTACAALVLVTWALFGCSSDGETEPLADLLIITDQNITAIEIVFGKTTIAVTETLQLQATNGPDGEDITTALRWSSSNPDIARIGGAGVVEGVADGTARIRAEIGDIEGTFDVTVSAAPLADVTVSAVTTPADVCDSLQLTATATFSDGRNDVVTDTADWQSSDSTVAEFDTVTLGLINTFASGNVDVTATVGDITSAIFPLVIADSLTALTVDSTNTTVEIAATEQLTANGDYTDNSTRDVSRNVTWASSAEAIATVDDAGLLTGVASGSSQITATCNSIVGSQMFTIGTGEPAIVDLEIDQTPPFMLLAGATLQLTVTAEFADGSTLDVTEEAEWTVLAGQGNGAASVSNVAGSKGFVTAIFVGMSFVSVSYEGEDDTVQIDVIG